MRQSLSAVPPVIPSPRPEIIGTQTSSQASSGARTSETLSPTPPVECLSILGGESFGYLKTLPLSIMAVVKLRLSAGGHSRKKNPLAPGALFLLGNLPPGKPADSGLFFFAGRSPPAPLFLVY